MLLKDIGVKQFRRRVLGVQFRTWAWDLRLGALDLAVEAEAS